MILINRVTQIIDAAAGTTQFTYDPNRNLLLVTDAKNQTTIYTYDKRKRQWKCLKNFQNYSNGKL
ncbi:MAG: hypothetical protein HY036_08860 [Nitrospirae bacterium]|nr:hypothetical protein [Nitrospirota bacterium]MBI3352676.1 hypothetical protein [Nitrospirota bacterium]